MQKAPTLSKFLIISDDPYITAQISSLLSKRGHYTPVLDCPRLTRHDADNEVLRRNNVAARFQPNPIIFAKAEQKVKDSFKEKFPNKIVEYVESIDDLTNIEKLSVTRPEEKLTWSKKNIGVGLLLALRQKKEIVFAENGTSEDCAYSDLEHLVVCEEGDELAQVIAANYAYSIGAGLCLISELEEGKAETICEAFYSSADHADITQTEKLEQLKEMLREASANIPLDGKKMLTFISGKIPWGFAYPEIPTTHIFNYPDMGISILNAMIPEQPNTQGLSLGVMIDPEQVEASEVETVKESLGQRGMILKTLKGSGANVYNVTRNIGLLPYDFLLISTHCGDASGWEWTYEYKDSEGIERTLVTHTTIGVGNIPHEDELLEVMQFSKFTSLDGVNWNDPKAKEELYVGTAILDYIERSRDMDDFKPVKKVPINRVRGSSALKMWDNNYIPVPEHIAGDSLPIILNNACSSWHRLAGDFIFGQARVYIGTLFEVMDAQACEIAIKLTSKYFGKSLAVALWRAQNDVYQDSIKRPYIMVGPHFQRLRITSEDKAKRVFQNMTRSGANMARSLNDNNKDDFANKKIKENLDFLKAEIELVAKMVSKRYK
ncbi:MAG: hypothetical protein CL570_04370 [Alphaproteobacteria bacterium]|nr:hypothetical protein [Alphaproteobacteria bacterium]|tara:strand:- start:8288 stop:10102 length:1815 start_codon:yes stop_codon:yes gene_type:complete